MALIGYKRGQGSIILRVKILNSSVTTGAGLTGLTSASTGLIIAAIADNEATSTAYTVAGTNVETITTLGTYAAPTSGKCRFKEVDATNHKGVYEIQLADARYAVSSAKSLLVSISGATNAAETDVVIPLQDLDPYDSVRAGLTAMPNVSSGSAGAIVTSGTGTAQLSTSSGLVTLAGVTHTGAVIPTVTTVTNQLTAAQIATGVWQDATAGDFTVSSSIGKSLYTSGVVPGGSGGLFIAGTNAATTVTTAFTSTFTGNLTGNVGGNVTGSVGSVASGGITSASFGAGAITATVIATDAIDADALAADAVTEIWSKTMTELTSVPAATGGTALQAITFLLEAAGHKITQTSTTQTLYKADSSTALATSTVADDGTTFSRAKLS